MSAKKSGFHEMLPSKSLSISKMTLPASFVGNTLNHPDRIFEIPTSLSRSFHESGDVFIIHVRKTKQIGGHDRPPPSQFAKNHPSFQELFVTTKIV